MTAIGEVRMWLLRGAATMDIHARCLEKAGQRAMAEELRRDAAEARRVSRLAWHLVRDAS